MRKFAHAQQKPRLYGKRKMHKFDPVEALSLGLIMLIAFMAGVVFWMRVTSEGLY